MKLFSALRTPAWEHRDPERRAAAVRAEQAPELIARLAQIAADDDAPTVRRAALSRLTDLALLLQRQRNDADGETRAAALARASQLLLDPSAGATLAARRDAIATLPEMLLERVADAAPEVELRRAALSRLHKPGLLLRRAAEDPDATLRLDLVARIDDVAALDRLAEQTRRRDKALTRAARERAQMLRLARGDTQALDREAALLCEQLTAWAQEPPADIEARLAECEAQWRTPREALDAALQRRVEAHFVRVHDALAMRAHREAEANRPAAVEAPPPAPAAPPIDWSGFDHELDAARRGVADRKLGAARPALERAQAALASLPRPDRGRRERLAHVEAKLAELAEWERWSGNRARARLCEQLEALIVAGHHPDAVLEGVRAAQRDWARIEAAEPGDVKRDSGLARRFRALCARAMAPTQAYFEQRHTLRESRREAIDALLMRVTPETLAAQTPAQLVPLRRELTAALRQLDEVEPKARTALARGLRAALTQLDAALAAQRDDAAQARQHHLAKLRRELTRADAASAAALVRQRQLEWNALPRAGRDQAEALEAQWRALIEPVFAQERAVRDEATQRAQHLERESRRLLGEIAALAQGDVAHVDSKLAALTGEWRELQAKERRDESRPTTRGQPRRDTTQRDKPGGRDSSRRAAPNDAERAVDAAVDRVRRAQAVAEQARRGDRLRALVAAAELFAEVEQQRVAEEAALARWNALALDAAERRRLEPRWQRARDAHGAVDSNASTDAGLWLLEAELDAGLDSPPEAQSQRRQLQMQRLATRLQGATDSNAIDPRERLLRWAELGPRSDDPAHTERLARVLAHWVA